MYFITSTVKNWIKIFENEKFLNIIVDSLNFQIKQGKIRLHGYVIMPNHMHIIISVNEPLMLSDFLRDFHKFTAQQILKIMRMEDLNLLRKFKSERNDRIYQFWQVSHAVKQIENFEFMRQKLQYIHNNPCSDKWQLCDFPEEYLYSSTKDYILDQKGLIDLDKIGL